MRVLVVNAGSSSLKLSVVGPGDRSLLDRDLPLAGPDDVADVLGTALGDVPDVDAAGHRVVHGGLEFRAPVVLGADVDARLARLAALAPLHNPPALSAIARLQALRPGLPQVACFDTAFHATMPDEATTYALPETWRRHGLRRFGFHGLSHGWAARRAAELLDRPVSTLRLVTAHLGAGASLAAVAGGRSVDTTMGFSPLDGLVMATRSGSVDPGVLVWMLRHGHVGVDEIEDVLARRSGLLGLAGSADLRQVFDAADHGEGRARLAVEVTVHRLRAAVAAMAAAMDGLDGLVFTGGAGEGSARLRRLTTAGLGFLGVTLDETRNEGRCADRPVAPDRVVSPDGVVPAVVVVHAREDLEIARQVRTVLDRP